MRNLKLSLASAVVLVSTAAVCFAQEPTELPALPGGSHAAANETHAEHTVPYNHPTVPDDTMWVGIMVMVATGIFLAAMVIGPYVRSEMPEEVPVAHSHDEPPGASHHHGPGGTVQPGPEHDLPGGHSGGHH